MVNALSIYITAMIVLFVVMISLPPMGIMLQAESLMIGMGMGTFLFPIMMYAIKKWKTKIKVQMMLKELSEIRHEQEKQGKNEIPDIP